MVEWVNKTNARLQDLMAERGWNATQTALRAQLGKGAVNELLNHSTRKPRKQTLQKLAKLFDVSQDYLAGYSDVRSCNPDFEIDDTFGADQAKEVLNFIQPEKNFLGQVIAVRVLRDFHGLSLRKGGLLFVEDACNPAQGSMVVWKDAFGFLSVGHFLSPYLVIPDSGNVAHKVIEDVSSIVGIVRAVVDLK